MSTELETTAQELVKELEALGYADPEEPVSGTDTVDLMVGYYHALKKITKPPEPEPEWQKCPGCGKELDRVWREERTLYHYFIDELGEHQETKLEECQEVLSPTRCLNCDTDVTAITNV